MFDAGVVRGVERVGDVVEEGEGTLLEDSLGFVVLQKEPGSGQSTESQRGQASDRRGSAGVVTNGCNHHKMDIL